MAAPKKATSGGSVVDTLKLKPSDAIHAINHMIMVNLDNAKRGKSRRGLFLWGPPGIGKSAIMKQVAEKNGMRLVDLRLIQMEPTDLRGIPVPVTRKVNGVDQTTVFWAPPGFLPQPGEKAIIFLDELPNAAPSVQAVAYQLVLDGRIGEYVVPEESVVFAAGNRETDKGATFKMPRPLVNRFDHIEVEVSFKDFQVYALNNVFNKDVVGYLSAFENDLFDFDPSTASRGFPTPRSWEMVSDIVDQPNSVNLSETVLMALIAGAVGDGIATKFMAYRRNVTKLPRSADILSGAVTELAEAEVSLMYALTVSLCYELQKRFKELANVKVKGEEHKAFGINMDNFLGFMMKNFKPELVIMGARTALSLFKIQFDPRGMKNWRQFADKYQDLILKA